MKRCPDRMHACMQALACKIISKRKLKTPSDRAEIRNEISVLKHLDGHPNVVRVVGGYEDREDVHIVMEVRTSC